MHIRSPMLVTLSAQPDVERADGFRAAPGGGNTRSGTLLLVEAYAAIWLLVFALIVWSLRRQGRMNARIARLERQLARAQSEDEAVGESDGPASTA